MKRKKFESLRLINLVTAAVIAVFVTSALSAITLRVPSDYTTMQAAIAAANNGDTVLVADGTYRGAGNRDLDFLGKAILLKSENGPAKTIIDCQGDPLYYHFGIIFHSGEDSNSVVDGLGISNTYDTLAAINCFSSSPTIRNCVLRYNLAGGLLAASGSNPIVTSSTISDNTPHGVHIVGGSVTLTKCAITSNAGDGVRGEFSPILSISESEISTNGHYGVNFETVSSTGVATISDCLINGNALDGLYFDLMTGGKFIVESCTVLSNRDGIAFLFDMPKSGTGGERPFFPDNSVIANTITFNNRNAGIYNTWVLDFPYVLNCNDSYHNPGGNFVNMPYGAGDANGNISSNPLFCWGGIPPYAGNYHISAYSPCAPVHNSCGVLIGKYDVGCSYVLGDVDQSGNVDISDPVYLIGVIFGAGACCPFPQLAGDADCSGSIDISDAVFLIAYIFGGGPAPGTGC